MGIGWTDIYQYAMLAFGMVGIVVVVVTFVRPGLGSGMGDLGSSTIIGVLIALSIVFMGLMRDRRTANIERMVKALYDHFGLDDDPPVPGSSAVGKGHGRGGAPCGGDESTTGGSKGDNGS